MKGKKSEENVKQVAAMMDSIIGDTSVPRNIRRSLEEAKAKLLTKEDIIIRAGGAIYVVEDIANDINMPLHTRTQIWSILSALETIKE